MDRDGFHKITVQNGSGTLYYGKTRMRKGNYYVKFPDGEDNLYQVTIRRVFVGSGFIDENLYVEKAVIKTTWHGMPVEIDITKKCKVAPYTHEMR